MACTISADEIKRVKGQGFLNQKGTDLFNGRVITVNGKITADQALVIAEAAKLYGDGTMMFTTRLTVEVSGIHFDNIPAFQEYVAKAGLVTGGTGAMVRPVVSCKATTCQYGLYDAYSLSEKIHERFYLGYHGVRLPHKFKIACGGCPNNCVKPDLNDLGIIGQMIPTVDAESCRSCKNCKIMAVCPMGAAGMDENGTLALDDAVCKKCGRCVGKCPFNATPEGTPAFKICIGGRWGKKGAQGLALNRMFTSEEEVLNVVEKAILFYREQGKTGERFGDTIARLGFDYCEKEILSDEILQRKQAILDAADLPMSR